MKNLLLPKSLLCSYTYSKADKISQNAFKVKAILDALEEHDKLFWFYQKGNPSLVAEAKQRVFEYTCTHYNPTKGTFSGYVNALTATPFSKDIRLAKKEIPMSVAASSVGIDDSECNRTLEETVAVSNVEKTETGFASVSNSVSPDFTDLAVDIITAEELKTNIPKLFLEYPDDIHLLLGKINEQDGKRYTFSESFLRKFNKLREYDGYLEEMLALYNKYLADFDLFLIQLRYELGNADFKFYETDFRSLKPQSSGTRVCDKSGRVYSDYDTIGAKYITSPLIKNHVIVQLDYSSFLNMIDSILKADSTSALKLQIEDGYTLRTLAGSVMSDISPSYDEFLKLQLYEYISNALRSCSGKLLNIGSSNAYLLVNRQKVKLLRNRGYVRGIPVRYDYLIIDYLKGV
jgi:hypothetical protein